jgi:hypothetical protein
MMNPDFMYSTEVYLKFLSLFEQYLVIFTYLKKFIIVYRRNIISNIFKKIHNIYPLSYYVSKRKHAKYKYI